ncbi:MAG: DUF1080 domain-containing protein, partial [Gemmatimonadales bacterium]
TGRVWKAHDPERPAPNIVHPGATNAEPPEDAIVLFGGGPLNQWTTPSGGTPTWRVGDGFFETVPGAGPLVTRQGFGDVQLHVEWSTPPNPTGNGQNRGNSGVILMGRYEIQVLDSWGNRTYPDGQAGAVYGQHPPLVNASRGPGEWQTYDIVFRRPRFRPDGTLLRPARFTVLHNGVLIQDAATVWGPTNWLVAGKYQRHPDRLPLLLQDHEHPVRYRNVWVRELPDLPADEEGAATSRPAVQLTTAQLDRLTGTYRNGDRTVAVIRRQGRGLLLDLFERTFAIVPESATRFTFPTTAGTIDFSPGPGGTGVVIRIAEAVIEGTRTR